MFVKGPGKFCGFCVKSLGGIWGWLLGGWGHGGVAKGISGPGVVGVFGLCEGRVKDGAFFEGDGGARSEPEARYGFSNSIYEARAGARGQGLCQGWDADGERGRYGDADADGERGARRACQGLFFLLLHSGDWDFAAITEFQSQLFDT